MHSSDKERVFDEAAPDTMNLLTVGSRQKALLRALLVYLLVIVGSVFLPAVREFEQLLLLLVGIVIVYLTARLCWALYGRGSAILLTLLSCIPYVNIVIILLASGKATRILKGKGFKVGLLGANLSEVEGRGEG
ncbi:hypothetical protein [Desulfosediminicola flagellatus]|uniref:hypothetical protein n=1 Tax=Desulfosediminicola flagellatus TaxID=2569541 RepID=UPI0010AB8F23|nr:hypothetical protein [Desulfosediminicola flagellatus]